MTQIRFIDTTLRDGHQSIWAFNMRTGMMLPALENMDEAGFDAMEFFVATLLKKKIQDLNEDPWQWLKLGTERVRNTPLRLHGGYRSGLKKIPPSVGKLLIQKVIDHGITTTRLSNSWNDFDVIGEQVNAIRPMGMESVVNLIYSVSPRHTDEYYVERAKAAVAIKPYRICFKDVGGLLTPDRVRSLLPKIQQVVGDIDLEFHAHCNNGLAPYNVLEAVKLGIRFVHTAIPPLASGTSQPSIFNVAGNLRALGYEPHVREEVLEPVKTHFTHIAEQAGFPIGAPFEYDQKWYSHQIPGGMTAHLRHQLKKVGMEHRLEETLEEAIQVRKDLGYPIMVTPLAQFVGSQAAVNVMVGERYKQVTDEVIQYALGLWGKEAQEVMDSDVKDKILSSNRAKELDVGPAPEPSLREVRKKYGESLTDEELILRVYVDEEAISIARKAPPPTEYLSAMQPLVDLMQRLTQRKGQRYISIQSGDMSLTLGPTAKNSSSGSKASG